MGSVSTAILSPWLGVAIGTTSQVTPASRESDGANRADISANEYRDRVGGKPECHYRRAEHQLEEGDGGGASIEPLADMPPERQDSYGRDCRDDQRPLDVISPNDQRQEGEEASKEDAGPSSLAGPLVAPAPGDTGGRHSGSRAILPGAQLGGGVSSPRIVQVSPRHRRSSYRSTSSPASLRAIKVGSAQGPTSMLGADRPGSMPRARSTSPPVAGR